MNIYIVQYHKGDTIPRAYTMLKSAIKGIERIPKYSSLTACLRSKGVYVNTELAIYRVKLSRYMREKQDDSIEVIEF